MRILVRRKRTVRRMIASATDMIITKEEKRRRGRGECKKEGKGAPEALMRLPMPYITTTHHTHTP